MRKGYKESRLPQQLVCRMRSCPPLIFVEFVVRVGLRKENLYMVISFQSNGNIWQFKYNRQVYIVSCLQNCLMQRNTNLGCRGNRYSSDALYKGAWSVELLCTCSNIVCV